MGAESAICPKTRLSERVANAEFAVCQIDGFWGYRWTRGPHRWPSFGQALLAVCRVEVLREQRGGVVTFRVTTGPGRDCVSSLVRPIILFFSAFFFAVIAALAPAPPCACCEFCEADIIALVSCPGIDRRCYDGCNVR
jgi:hypothetical protein